MQRLICIFAHSYFTRVSHDPRVMLYLHGGGYVAGNARHAKGMAGVSASKTKARTLCVAYRLAPKHPCPAAPEAALAGDRYLLSRGYDPARLTLIIVKRLFY